MAPKAPPPLTEDQKHVEASLLSLGAPATRATEIARNAKQSAVLNPILGAALDKDFTWDADRAKVLLVLTDKGTKLTEEEKVFYAKKCGEGKVEGLEKATAALKYLESHPSPISSEEFDKQSGLGIDITSLDLAALIPTSISSIPTVPASWPDFPPTLLALRTVPPLSFVNPGKLKDSLEPYFESLFGKKPAGAVKASKPSAAAKPKISDATKAEVESMKETKSMFATGWLSRLHPPGGNPQISEKLRENHLKATGGNVVTRFPPEPNGFLHIGHSKAIHVNFGYAKHHGGRTILRYDDTNPTAEEGRYFESILEMVRWLGYEPHEITYSSDNFMKLYEFAEELIKRDLAYVCFCTAEQQKKDRGEKSGDLPKPCPHRSKPSVESLEEFRRMRAGAYKKGECTLRMKQDLTNGNPQMWDLVAYRIIDDAEHHRTKKDWCIYPTYDFTHCLCDSLENISHSLCTVEFVLSRESYEWLCDALEVYKPRQSEYGRLNLEGTVMSKRKIKQLVDDGYVAGWDDPRMYTLIALRRRGVPPGAILNMVEDLGVSTALSMVELSKFDSSVRSYLEMSAPRLMLVLDPVRVTISNVPADFEVTSTKPLHPKQPQMGTVDVTFTNTFFIDRDDFRVHADKDYFRLAPGKSVGLFGANVVVTCTDFKVGTEGEVVEVVVKLENGEGQPVPKPKAYIQWVPLHERTKSPVMVDEVRIFNPLFKSANPLALKDKWLEDINPDSLKVVQGAMIEPSFFKFAQSTLSAERKAAVERIEKEIAKRAQGSKEISSPEEIAKSLVGNECIRFQGMRVGYFTVDREATIACLEGGAIQRGKQDRIVLNRIVSLKEDSGKS